MATHTDHGHTRLSATTTATTITPTTLPSPSLRKTACLALLPALPLCITHGALSHDLVPALGLIPLASSAGVSLFLVLRGRRRGGAGEGRRVDFEGGAEEAGIGPEDDYEEEATGERSDGGVLTHRILVFAVDVVHAVGLMVVLVFTWIRAGKVGDGRPELAMLAAYATVPLLVNFLIHLYLAAREFVAGLAIPGLIEYTAWRAVPADCPHCGHRLRPDALPPIPWYETVSRPNVSFPQVRVPAISRPSLPAFKLPKFSGLRVPNWARGPNQEHANLFVDDDQNDRDRYRDDPDEPFGAPSGSTTVVATGSAGPAPVEEVVVGKKDKKRTASSSLFGEDGGGSWA